MTENPPPAPDKAKARLRRELLQRRRALGKAERGREERHILGTLQGLPELVRAQRVFCFISHGGEVDTRCLIDFLLESGRQVCVPRVLPDGAMQAIPFSDWAGLRPGPHGIPEPAAARAETGKIDVCITPGLGFTETGKRIGYGQGYYDRWFARHPVGCRIGIAYDCQVVDDLPWESRDVPVTHLVTGTRSIIVEP